MCGRVRAPPGPVPKGQSSLSCECETHTGPRPPPKLGRNKTAFPLAFPWNGWREPGGSLRKNAPNQSCRGLLQPTPDVPLRKNVHRGLFLEGHRAARPIERLHFCRKCPSHLLCPCPFSPGMSPFIQRQNKRGYVASTPGNESHAQLSLTYGSLHSILTTKERRGWN